MIAERRFDQIPWLRVFVEGVVIVGGRLSVWAIWISKLRPRFQGYPNTWVERPA